MSIVKKTRAATVKQQKSKKSPDKSAAARMPAKVALPPANRAAIEQSLSVGMGRALHIHLKRLTRKGLTAEMTVSEDHINRSGRINGGILMSFADVLGAIGTVANLPEGYRTTTLESKTNFAAGEGANDWRTPCRCASAAPPWCGRPRSATLMARGWRSSRRRRS